MYVSARGERGLDFSYVHVVLCVFVSAHKMYVRSGWRAGRLVYLVAFLAYRTEWDVWGAWLPGSRQLEVGVLKLFI